MNKNSKRSADRAPTMSITFIAVFFPDSQMCIEARPFLDSYGLYSTFFFAYIIAGGEILAKLSLDSLDRSKQIRASHVNMIQTFYVMTDVGMISQYRQVRHMINVDGMLDPYETPMCL